MFGKFLFTTKKLLINISNIGMYSMRVLGLWCVQPFFWPGVWAIFFLLLPFLLLFKLSFASAMVTIPPYSSLTFWQDGVLKLIIDFTNYSVLLFDSSYLQAFVNSFVLAICATLLCGLIAYPIAFAIASCTNTMTQNMLTVLLIMPFWTIFLIRIYACLSLISPNGVLNKFLIYYNIIDRPIQMMYNSFAVCCGIAYVYLPFMTLPIYSVLIKLDNIFVDAAYMLRCYPIKTFFKIILPMTKNGIITGGTFVFIASLGEYVIPELLGGTNTITIGRIIWNEFFIHANWPLACAISIMMIIMIILPISWWYKKYK